MFDGEGFQGRSGGFVSPISAGPERPGQDFFAFPEGFWRQNAFGLPIPEDLEWQRTCFLALPEGLEWQSKPFLALPEGREWQSKSVLPFRRAVKRPIKAVFPIDRDSVLANESCRIPARPCGARKTPAMRSRSGNAATHRLTASRSYRCPTRDDTQRARFRSTSQARFGYMNMMNLAFVVGVSNYSSLDNLPACRADADLLVKLLKGTHRYTQVIYFVDNTRSSHVKAGLADFVRHYARRSIDEFFWYFSGHGAFSEGEFRYLLSDYDELRPMQTTLSNSDVDGFIRSLQPKLTVKVVDACNAGTTYVKESNALRKHLDKSGRTFRNCYFMFSSLNSQPSYQNAQVSIFTKSFCRSIACSPSNEIRYKDIIDFVSDEFDGSRQQTPLFVTQAIFTERFASNVAELKNLLPADFRTSSERRRSVETPAPRPTSVRFSPEEISALFGQEDAQLEDPQRLREYYFKSDIYESVTVDQPLRVLVGHKGLGKSALFRVAVSESRDAFRFCILLRPDDIVDLSTDVKDFLKTIRSWKDGLNQLIANRVLRQVGVEGDLPPPNAARELELISYLRQRFTEARIEDEWAKRAVDKFQSDPVIDVYIDDVERGWQGVKAHVSRISALFNAVRDIASESRGVHFKISLRSDVYYLVRTSDESTDKIEGSVVWYTWTNHEIFVLLIKRILTFFGKPADEARLLQSPQGELATYLNLVMEERFSGEGLWSNTPMKYVLMSLIRKRPRDLIKLCYLAATRAYRTKSSLIGTIHVLSSLEEYSHGRLLDAVTEFRSELPDVERLLVQMRPSKKERTAKEGYVYSTERLLQKDRITPKRRAAARGCEQTRVAWIQCVNLVSSNGPMDNQHRLGARFRVRDALLPRSSMAAGEMAALRRSAFTSRKATGNGLLVRDLCLNEFRQEDE